MCTCLPCSVLFLSISSINKIPSCLIFSKLSVCPLESQGYHVHRSLPPLQRSVNKLLKTFSLGKLKEERGRPRR